MFSLVEGFFSVEFFAVHDEIPHLTMYQSSNFVKCSENPVLILLLQYEGAVPCAAKWRSSLDMAGAGGNRQLGSEQVEFR